MRRNYSVSKSKEAAEEEKAALYDLLCACDSSASNILAVLFFHLANTSTYCACNNELTVKLTAKAAADPPNAMEVKRLGLTGSDMFSKSIRTKNEVLLCTECRYY